MSTPVRMQRVIHGDCLRALAGLDIDVVITDPVWPNAPDGLFPQVKDPYRLFAEAMAALPASVKRVVVVLRCDSDPRFLRNIPERLPFFRTMILPYAMPHYIGRVLGGDEIAYWFGSPIASSPGRRLVPGRGPHAQPAHRPPNGHPCSRAQIHFDWLVYWATDDGETVCDPFAGSGTTGVACVHNDREFIGIEIEERYARLAESRVSLAASQGRLFAGRHTPASSTISMALL